MSTYTRNEADMIVRHMIEEAFEKDGINADYSGIVTAAISQFFDVPYTLEKAAHLQCALEIHEELSQVALRTHPDLVWEKETGTDNSAEVVGSLEEQLNIAVNSIVETLGYTGKWILRYS